MRLRSIDLCRDRASRCDSLEELAMHRALSEHLLRAHGGRQRDIEAIHLQMMRAAAEI
jgi:hypothetical protein